MIETQDNRPRCPEPLQATDGGADVVIILTKLCVVPHSDANQSNGSDSADYAIGDGANVASASIVAGRRQRGLGRW